MSHFGAICCPIHASYILSTFVVACNKREIPVTAAVMARN
jgi:hypothetical protein